ncbi:VOC family protein [Streptomyces sp. NPDC018045]|uniref:VOC family protein n=1 Tax=Streptomyces sp. NPDC018045 TaxID=3365037 RepID=UPI0037B49018
MACRISELVIDAADAERLAVFWSEVLGYVELGREDDGSIEVGPPDAGFGGPQPTLVLSPSGDPRPGKLRLHIDVNATDRDQDAEWERLLALGARPADVGQTGTESRRVPRSPAIRVGRTSASACRQAARAASRSRAASQDM